MGFDTNLRLSDSPSIGEFAADRHFLNRRGRGYASNDRFEGQPAPAQPSNFLQCRFSIFRTDSVSVTSTLFAGGDWRWRLSDHKGAILVEAGGYGSEARCREAVTILQAHAARATAG